MPHHLNFSKPNFLDRFFRQTKRRVDRVSSFLHRKSVSRNLPACAIHADRLAIATVYEHDQLRRNENNREPPLAIFQENHFRTFLVALSTPEMSIHATSSSNHQRSEQIVSACAGCRDPSACQLAHTVPKNVRGGLAEIETHTLE